MRLISNFKRAKYFGAASVLLLAAMPVVPMANVFADSSNPFCVEGGDCYATLQAAFDVAPTDGTATRVYLNSTDSVVKDGGAVLRSGQNVTLDLKNKTYDISDNTVGSTGTETLAFQLLKGSTFYLKNGTITASAAKAKIWLQNYANTTLNNVILDATNYSQAKYVASNNCGSLTVTGNTQIIANANGVAFDLWYGMSSVYNDGVTVTFDDDFTGRVEGKVEYGAKNALDGWRDKTKLDIKSGTFDVTFAGSSTDALTGANINVSGSAVGGDFPNFPTNIDQGNAVYRNADGTYVIDSAPDVDNVPARALVEVGDEETTIDNLADNDAIQNYAKIVGDNGTTFTKPNKVVATKAGLSHVKIEFEIYDSNGVRNTVYDRTINIHAYTANDIGAIPMAKGSMRDDLALEFSVDGNTYDTLEVRSTDESKMTIASNGDGTYTVNALENGDAKIEGKVTINSADQETTGWLTLGTVRVYTFNAAEEVTVPVSTTALDVNGGVIANITNPGAISVELEGDAATLEDTTADTAKITATAAGDATLIYKAGDTEIGRTTVHAYVMPTLTDMLIQSWDSVGDLSTSATFPKLEGTNLPTYSLTSGNTQLVAIENGAGGTKTVRTRWSHQHSGNTTVTVHYNDSLGTTDTFRVRVSKFTTDVKTEYNIVKGGSVNFAMREHNNRGTLSCEIGDENCSNSDDLTITRSNGSYTVRSGDNTAVGKYTLRFTDEFGNDTAATRNVDVYVYKMTTPAHHYFFAEMTGASVEFTDINVGDEINAVVPGRAEITAEVTSGDANAVDLTKIADGKVTIKKPGEYKVTYTDTMAGGQGDEVGTYTATFRVYALKAEADDEIVNLNANEVYGWTIDPSQTYGDVEVSIYRRNPAGEHNRRVYHSETRYEATGTDVENFTFDPARYGEGIYTIRIENTSVGNHNLPALVEEATFYAVAREYDFVMVERGKPVTITSDSRWSVDYAEEYYSGSLDVEDNVAVLDTSELSLGSTWAAMYHTFSLNGQTVRVPLKWVTVVVYEVVPTEDSAELNQGEVTTATVKDLYERAAAATAGLIRDLVAAGVPEENVYCSMYSISCYWAWGELAFTDMLMNEHLTLNDVKKAFNLTEEQAGMVNFELIQQAIDEFKTVLGGDEWDETGLRTAASLNLLNSDTISGLGLPLETEVKVTPLAEAAVDAGEKTEIKAALAEAGIEVDNIDYYDVSVFLQVGNMSVGKLHKLNGEITVALAKTSDPASGYTRQYFVVRKHGDNKAIVLTEGVDFYIENGVIYVISDEFSTYAVAYKDTLIPKAPDTGDEATAAESASANVSTAVVVAIAAVVLAGAAVFAKRK